MNSLSDTPSALDIEPIEITWEMSFPYVKSTYSHSFNSDIFENKFDISDLAKNYTKILPEGITPLLNSAFQNKLNRFCEWDISKLNPQQKKAAVLAAKIFKRGVPIKGEENSSDTPKYRQGSYKLAVEASFENSNSWKALLETKNLFFVIDHNVDKAWSLSEKLNSSYHIEKTSEQNKTLETVLRLIEQSNSLDSKPTWVIVGGGVLADTASFAASLVGCPFILVPTTLLSMVDACVGGKTGVNYPPYGKNQVGLFSFPAKVLCYLSFLESLEDRDIVSGYAECLKHGLLSGKEDLLNEFSFSEGKNKFALSVSSLREFIKVKSDVVKKDPSEASIRATLNLGHTLAHAIEALSHKNNQGDDVIRHGEAVHFGILFSLYLSCELLSFPDEKLLSIQSIIKRIFTDLKKTKLYDFMGYSHSLTDEKAFDGVFEYIKSDKKVSDSSQKESTNWILLQDIGKPYEVSKNNFLTPVDRKTLFKCWTRFLTALN